MSHVSCESIGYTKFHLPYRPIRKFEYEEFDALDKVTCAALNSGPWALAPGLELGRPSSRVPPRQRGLRRDQCQRARPGANPTFPTTITAVLDLYRFFSFRLSLLYIATLCTSENHTTPLHHRDMAPLKVGDTFPQGVKFEYVLHLLVAAHIHHCCSSVSSFALRRIAQALGTC